MSVPHTRDEFVVLWAEYTGARLDAASGAYDTMIETMRAVLLAGGEIELSGIGRLELREHPATERPNNLTGEGTVVIPRRARLKLYADPDFERRAIEVMPRTEGQRA